MKRSTVLDSQSLVHESTSRRGKTSKIRKSRILLVDDEFTVLRSVHRALSSQWAVTMTQSVSGALEMLEQSSFFAVVTDYDMSEHNGLWLLEHIKEQFPQTHRVLSSGSEPDTFVESIQSGLVQHFLPKPLEPSLLLDALS